MSALAKIRQAGFSVEVTPRGTLKVSPKEKLSDGQRQWLKLHKSEIVSELQTKPEMDSANELPAPALTIAELLVVLDGNKDVEQATRRLGELLARPRQVQVSCADCLHFAPDTIGDGSGIGTCAVNAATLGARYPNSKRYCSEFSGKKNTELPDGQPEAR